MIDMLQLVAWHSYVEKSLSFIAYEYNVLPEKWQALVSPQLTFFVYYLKNNGRIFTFVRRLLIHEKTKIRR